MGSPIVNAANDAVGTLDDLIVTPDARVSFAVLSIGGFLGLGHEIRRGALQRS